MIDRLRLVPRGGNEWQSGSPRWKSSTLSDDKKEVIVGASGKYIGDLEPRFARECLDNLIDALVRAKGALAPSVNAGPSVAAVPAPKVNGSGDGDRMKLDLKSRRTSP